jgi:hypothetical protein
MHQVNSATVNALAPEQARETPLLLVENMAAMTPRYNASAISTHSARSALTKYKMVARLHSTNDKKVC